MTPATPPPARSGGARSPASSGGGSSGGASSGGAAGSSGSAAAFSTGAAASPGGAGSSALDRTTPPAPGPIRPFHLAPVEGEDLANGLRVRSMVRGDIPLVSGVLVLDAGEIALPPQRAGLAVLTGDTLTGGTADRSGTELAEALERLGVSLRVSTGWDATSASFTCLAERLDETLAVVAEVVREAAFPLEEVERVRRQRLAAIRQRRMEPAQLADDEMDRVLFPAGHPCARPLSGEPESVEAVGRDDVVGFAEDRYRPGGAGFAVVGDLTGAEVVELVDRHFSGWSGRAAARLDLPAMVAPGEPSVVIVHRPGAVQSEIRVGLPGPARGHPDEPALDVANSVLGGAFTSRLNLSLRERHGFTYGVRSRFSRRREVGSFIVGTAVQTEVTARALEEAVGELRRFVAEGPTPEEVAQARDYLAGVFPLRMETAAHLAARVAEILIFDLPADHHHHYRERIRAVTDEAASEAVARHLAAAERAPIVIVGDAERLEQEVTALGLGAVSVRTL